MAPGPSSRLPDAPRLREPVPSVWEGGAAAAGAARGGPVHPGGPAGSAQVGRPRGASPGRGSVLAGLSWAGGGAFLWTVGRLQTLRTSEGLRTERGPGTSWVLPSARGSRGREWRVNSLSWPGDAGSSRGLMEPGEPVGGGGADGSWKELLAAVAPHPQDQQDLGNSGPSCVGKAWEHVRFRPPPGDRALLASPASEPGSSQGCKSLSCKTLGCLGLSLPICELVTAVPWGRRETGWRVGL